MPTTKHACAYVLIASLGFCALACGDDDDGNSGGTGSSGKGGSGSAGKGGSGSSGKGGSGSAGTGSAGTGSGSTVTADDALAGACQMMEMMTGTDMMCTGIEEYSKCALDDCGLQDCFDGAACSAYEKCVRDAKDPCTNTCMPSSECSTCIENTSMCQLDMCFSKIQCGEVTSGGACDQLDDCCASLDAQMKSICDMTAGPVKVGGDMACQQLIDAFCPMM